MKNDLYQRLRKAIRSGNVSDIQIALNPPIHEIAVFLSEGDLAKYGNEVCVCTDTGKVLTKEQIQSRGGKHITIDLIEDNHTRVKKGKPVVKLYNGIDIDRI